MLPIVSKFCALVFAREVALAIEQLRVVPEKVGIYYFDFDPAVATVAVLIGWGVSDEILGAQLLIDLLKRSLKFAGLLGKKCAPPGSV